MKSGMNARSARFVARRLPALVAAAEADPVVRIDDHERLVPETDRLEPVDEPAEQRIRVADLRQVPLPRLEREVGAPPELVRPPRRAGVETARRRPSAV